MKRITLIIALLLVVFIATPNSTTPSDTTLQYRNRTIVISEQENEMNISVFAQNEEGDTIQQEKIYEGVFTDGRSVERVYENRFDISIPDIFKPKSKRKASRAHWAGFGVGFSNLPQGFDFDGELASVLNLNRSLQYNLNLLEKSWRMGNSNFTGIMGAGIQFNAMHFQSNKAIEVIDYQSVITTTDPTMKYKRSRLHYTYLTFPFLVETNWNIGRGTHFFINAGVVGKVKTASSSKIWWNDENGRKQKTKLPGNLNIRPVTFDLLLQAGINDFGLFASYSPVKLFRDNKGPEGNQATIGLQLYF